MDKTTKEILTEARSLITNPDNWTQGFFARDGDGVLLESDSPGATCWCAWGAIQKVVGVSLLSKAHNLYLWDTLWNATGEPDFGSSSHVIWSYNDTHTHEEVLAVFDKAIAAC